MTIRVMALDAEQLAAMPSHAREWAGRALNTEPVDWWAWENAVVRCYQYAGLVKPRTVRTTSPLALARALFQARVNEVLGDEIRALVGLMRRVTQARVDRVVFRLFDRGVAARVQHGVYDPVDALACGEAISRGVAEALVAGPLIGDPSGVWDSARGAARELVRGRRHRDIRRVTPEWHSWTLHLGGQFEAAWSAYATFLAEVYPDAAHRGWRGRIEAFTAAQSAGWWWPHLDFVVVCDPPTVVRTEPSPDGLGRPHCDSGPAVEWSDGWQLYFWHGTRVPAWVVHEPTVAAINEESNVEIRRCGIEAMGWDAYIDEAGLRLVDHTDDPGNPDCELLLYEVPPAMWGVGARVLLATNGSLERDGTRRRYGLPVPAHVETAVEAAAWTYGLRPEQYARLDRRT
jgi:hypothetical protein